MFPPIQDKLPSIITLLLDMQIALIQAVHPLLRAVDVDTDEKDEVMNLFFYYDGEISDELFDLASVASAEAGVTLPYFTNNKIIRLNFPNKIPVKGRLAFLRKGEELSTEYKKEKKYKDAPGMDPILQIYLEIQQALLGKVSSSLRKVLFTICPEEKKMSYHFYFDGEISEEDSKLAHEAINEASLAFTDYKSEREILRVDYPTKISPLGKRYAFERYEK